jgi:DNA ligase (NAD+)
MATNNKMATKPKTFRTTAAIIKKIKANPREYGLTLEISELVQVLKKLRDAYDNTDTPLVDDSTYDKLFELLEERDPNNLFLSEAGSVVVSKNKVSLEFPMGSLQKIKPSTKDLAKWLESYKGPYVCSSKLDGVSVQLYKKKDGVIELYTRGKGTSEGNIGESITHLLLYINVGQIKNIPLGTSIRGELIIKRATFETFNKLEKEPYKNIRNMVAGIVNSKKLNTNNAKLIDMVAYSILSPEYDQSMQMTLLEKWKINTVDYQIVKKLDETILEKMLIDKRKSSIYDIDGVVCIDSSKVYKLLPGNPPYGFAFKMELDDQHTTATIVDIIWNPTMDSYLKPIVQIKPVNLVGSTITYATAYNAQFVEENKLGKGAQIKIIRSGDVIPKILETIKPADTILFPSVPYVWNETHVDIMIDYSKKIPPEIIAQVKIELIVHFFKGIGVKYLSDGIITKLYNNGYTSIKDILSADHTELEEIEGIGTKLVKKIYSDIDLKFKSVNIAIFMAATHIFGRSIGERKIKDIIKVYPNILHDTSTDSELVEKLLKIHGFSDIIANRFVENLAEFKKFCKDLNKVYSIEHIIKPIKVDKVDKLEKVNKKLLFVDKKICMTGFRNKDIETFIEDNGGSIVNSISKNTYMLIYADGETTSSKYLKATELKIILMSLSEFKNKYLK